MKGHFLYARRLLRKRMLQEWSGQRWVYVGKNAGHREALIGLLGEKALVPLGCRLHMIAEKLRQPFLDFIAELGRIQKDQLGWWSSTCSWKSSTACRRSQRLVRCTRVGRSCSEWSVAWWEDG